MLKHGYAPEEQYRRKGEQGPWTDVYALCATIYKCITGATPDDANDRLAEDELKPPSAYGIEIDPKCEAALMKGMSVKAADRYRTVGELIRGLFGEDPAFDAVAAPEKEEAAESAAATTDPDKTVYGGTTTDPEKTVYGGATADPDKTVYGGAEIPPAPPIAPEAAPKPKEESKKRTKKAILFSAIALVLVAAIVLPVVLVSGRKRPDPAGTEPSESTLIPPSETTLIPPSEASKTPEAPESDPVTPAGSEETPFETTKTPGSTIGKGDIYTFGSYEQDNNNTNGKEAIEWVVLSIDNGKALLVSKYALDNTKYNDTKVEITWATCSLRKWLNETFYNAAFNQFEKTRIVSTNLMNSKNNYTGVDGGENTTDKVFILSLDDVLCSEYGFSSSYNSLDLARRCQPTAYAKACGCYIITDTSDPSYGNCWWWLRSPGGDELGAADVDGNGAVICTGTSVNRSSHGVRPALWIDLES